MILALLRVEVALNMGIEIKDARAITRYLLFGSLAVTAAHLIATLGVTIVVPAGQGRCDRAQP